MTGPWNPERWHAATARLDELLELSPEERAARLHILRERDAALAADVDELLRDHDAARAAGFLGQDADALLTATAAGDGSFTITSVPIPPTLPAGSAFGPYRILRVLGRGGMGVVYEAEESESGRRVALKVLLQRLGDERERDRFEREGRLAASIDHPHCVYVFGATDVHGTPAIAMELMQGTLADRLSASGPLPPGEAVDAVLQLIEGLQAAADAGILHRDVKPSNCFVDADGAVKIGDFGISRSIRPTEETALSTRGQITGTPNYASPEQLRGATLDVRADIYSLGATLYELVTGRRPFTASDLMALLMAVANDPPEPPHRIAQAVPPQLGKVLLRCLAKRPEDRYPGYAALAAALEPYRSVAPTPATLGKRFAAGVIDQTLLICLALLAMRSSDGGVVPTPLAQIGLTATLWALICLYYGVAEALWRRSLGKALLSLTLVDALGRPARAAPCWARAALFSGAQAFPAVVAIAAPWWSTDASTWSGGSESLAQLVSLGLLFSSVRRANGYAALHDLATGTRVVEQRVAAPVARRATRAEPRRVLVRTADVRGSFAVLEGGLDDRPGWRPGVDDRLRRPVWIRDLPPGTRPLSQARASLARSTRLRWLAGRRTEREAWDVFESAEGVPLPRACTRGVTWAEARRWLIDVAHELAAQNGGDCPPLSLDRVWILETGRAKLLDDPAVDTPRSGGETEAAGFLADVVRAARAASREPWPLGAQHVVDTFAAGGWASIAEAARGLGQLGRTPAEASAGRRRLATAASLAPPLLVAATAMVGVGIAATSGREPIDARVVRSALVELAEAEHRPGVLSPADRAAIEDTLVTRYRAQLADPRLVDPGKSFARQLGREHGARAARLLRAYGRRPSGTGVDHDPGPIARRLLRRPAPAVRPPLAPAMQAIVDRESRRLDPPVLGVSVLASFVVLVVVALFALVLAPLTRSLLLRLFGHDIVTVDGRRASRARLLARTAAAWSPILLPAAALSLAGGVRSLGILTAILGVSMIVMAAGAVVAIAHPGRGLHDRLAGTWIVPQ